MPVEAKITSVIRQSIGGAAPGVGDGATGTNGIGGAGVSGSNLTIHNSGSITGGLAGDGVTQQYAIIFAGGANSLGSTGTISGGIDVMSGSFAPALSTSTIGTPLAVSGPVTFASGTRYVIRVSPSASDNLSTSGSATVTGVSASFDCFYLEVSAISGAVSRDCHARINAATDPERQVASRLPKLAPP